MKSYGFYKLSLSFTLIKILNSKPQEIGHHIYLVPLASFLFLSFSCISFSAAVGFSTSRGTMSSKGFNKTLQQK